MATEVVLPMLGVTVTKGKIVEWRKKEGDPVEKGEIIFVVETDKVATEVESPAGGVLARILVETGIEIPVLTLVALITEPGEELPEDYRAAGPAEAAVQVPASSDLDAVASATPAAAAAPPPNGPVRAVPAARRLAREKGVDLTALAGSGPEGVITAKDVEQAAAPAGVRVSTLARRLAEREGVGLALVEGTGTRGRIMRADVAAQVQRLAPAGPGLGEVIPMSNVRRVIARRMAESAFTAPHIYFFSEMEMGPLLALRRELVDQVEEVHGVRLSVNDFLIKAVALTLLEYPLLNSRIDGDNIVVNPEINVGLAVALPEGLIVPALESADRAGLADIARRRADLVERARVGKLTLPEIERGTFTVSSLAQFDITHFTAILNPPQVGILSVGKTEDRLYLDGDQVRSKKVAVMGLSVDHRIIDGAVAAAFLKALKAKLERPLITFVHF